MDPATYKSKLGTEIEIGTWGTACTGLFFLISAFVEYFTGLAWLSEMGCLVGIATITAILVRSRIRHGAGAQEYALQSNAAPIANSAKPGKVAE